MVTQAFNLSTHETEAGGWIPGSLSPANIVFVLCQAKLNRETLPQKT